ncbi:MAG: hypothetical protein ACKOC5_17220 [Chloroflexota bacterium]
MSRSLRVLFALVVSLSLALGVFAGAGTTQAFAASGSNTAGGYTPQASGAPDISYCYPSGYNRQGWRCGWRLAQAPYNLGDYNNYYYGYYYNPYYYGYPTGGYPPQPIADYGGNPRFGPYYYYYNPCYYNYYGPYCNGYWK